MWRRDGQVVAYLYLCEDQGKYVPENPHCQLVKNQDKEFKDACGNRWPKAGLDVFRFTKQKLFLKKGTWNKITYGACLNTEGNTSDGRLWLEVNGERMECGGIRFTKNVEKNVFKQLQMPNWFGGGDKSWAPKDDTWFKIRNVVYKF